MTFDEFKAKYENFILSPLTFPVPDVDTGKLLSWARQNKDCEFNTHVQMGSKLTKAEFDELHRSELSFFDSYFLLTGKPGQPSAWYNDFDKHFPALAKWIETMPIAGAPHFGFLLQKSKNTIKDFNPNLVSHIHTDEHNSFGIRLYLNSTKNRMMFYGIREGDIASHIAESNSTQSKEVYHKLDDNKSPVIVDGIPLSHDNFFDTPVASKLIQANTCMLINGIKASHFVLHEDEPDKITFLIMGRRDVKSRYDWDALDADIQKALIERPTEFLYYDDLRN